MSVDDQDDRMTLYRTSDIYFSAYLCAIDIDLQTTETDTTDGGKKKIFIFKVPRKDIDRMKAQFFGGGATVKVRKFVDALRNLKSMCFI